MSAPELVSLASRFRVRRRYTRSVHLERDLHTPGSLDGYIVSPLASEAAERIYDAILTAGAHKAWTVTGVYGTGKSAFAHFVCALAAPSDDPLRREALRLTGGKEGAQHPLVRRLKQRLPDEGLVRAVATGQREPLATTVLRALERGASQFRCGRVRWKNAVAAVQQAARRTRPLPSSRIVELARELAEASGTGVLLVIDELGKVLEHAARDLTGRDDVFLLQQLAEATQVAGAPLAVVGLLHQGFGEYGAGLALESRAEWLKVQGRFEDIVFAEPPSQVLRLIGSAIEPTKPDPAWDTGLRRLADAWVRSLAGRSSQPAPMGGSAAGQAGPTAQRQALGAPPGPGAAGTPLPVDPFIISALGAEVVRSVLPLHPVAALVLPTLCARYGQNDRSLFGFLTSEEPHAFGRFLREARGTPGALPQHGLADVYDYFAGLTAGAVGARPQLARWAEVHAVVADARGLDPESVAAVKTVAALNLAAASGPLRASRALTLAALAQRPGDRTERARWTQVLDALEQRGLIVYRRQLDEYRLWEGSDFDIEAAIRARTGRAPVSLASVLDQAVPLGPVVAQRHSHRTGTLRIFERRYTEDATVVAAPACAHASSDGLILYWVGRVAPPAPPATTADGRPVFLVEASAVTALAEAAAEYAALTDIDKSERHLQSDGVARREVRYRLRLAARLLERAVRSSLHGERLRCHVGTEVRVLGASALRALLSDACEQVYAQSPVLWHEMLNRRELTSQGAKSRRELIEAMLARGNEPRLALEGNGPTASMYTAFLLASGIHRQDAQGRWTFGRPSAEGLQPLWDAAVQFCHASNQAPRGVDELFATLEAPPIGAKRGILPVLLAAILLADEESLSVYREGSFLPALGAEHFEILVKHPGKFSIKHFALDGLRAEVFSDLEEILRAPGSHAPTTRNATILGVVRPLVRFVTTLPAATLRTQRLSAAALAVREALRTAREPDVLLFSELPAAVGVPTVGPEDPASPERRQAFRTALLHALRELKTFHELRRETCGQLLHAAFGTGLDPRSLRGELTTRARLLAERPLEERLRAFVQAAADDVPSDEEWLERVAMIVADRPLRTWGDDDADAFERRASEMARRFANLEALQADLAGALGPDAGTDVRRITVTRPDGRDVHRLVLLGQQQRAAVNLTVDALARQLAALPEAHRQAAIALLAESVIAPTDSGDALHASQHEAAQAPSGARPAQTPVPAAHG